MEKKIGIIGFGNMGRAIGEQLKADYKICCFDKDTSKISGLLDMQVFSNIQELVKKVDVVLLAVKPQDFCALLNEIKPLIKDQLLISIAAGISTSFIEDILGIVRVIRAMPNMPAKIGQGITCLSRGRFASEQDFDFSENIFVYLGETIRIEECLMNAATAISGSGPGYFYDLLESENIDASNANEVKEFARREFIPRLKQAAKAIGFKEEDADILAVSSGNGSFALLTKTKLSPVELKKQIASKGGTTEAALEVLHKGGSLEEAVKAALKRAEELSKSLPLGRQGGN